MKSLISSNTLRVYIIVLSKYKVLPSVNRVLHLSFQSGCHLFLSLASLPWIVFNTMLKRSNKNRHPCPCLAPDFKVKAFDFAIKCNNRCGVLLYGLYQVDEVSFHFKADECFYHEIVGV
jgi:hypothetical protein